MVKVEIIYHYCTPSPTFYHLVENLEGFVGFDRDYHIGYQSFTDGKFGQDKAHLFEVVRDLSRMKC